MVKLPLVVRGWYPKITWNVSDTLFPSQSVLALVVIAENVSVTGFGLPTEIATPGTGVGTVVGKPQDPPSYWRPGVVRLVLIQGWGTKPLLTVGKRESDPLVSSWLAE